MCLLTCFLRFLNFSGRHRSSPNDTLLTLLYLKIPVAEELLVLLAWIPSFVQTEQNNCSFSSSNLTPTDSMSLKDLAKVTLETTISNFSLVSTFLILSEGLVILSLQLDSTHFFQYSVS